ncbi:MAG: DUF1848 domain-containing protein [Desulfamplus sp.]|nr:DUF1848 domain-containing protein [Desulfamplus sp.]
MGIKWQKTEIKTLDDFQEGISPWIISASRATDIPAYYSEWFFDKLQKGYVKWVNPFNRLKPQYVAFKNTKCIVFWSKNPAPMIPFLNELDDRKIGYYFQFTVNDYEDENFEPNLPSLERRIETFKHLSNILGKKRVIWRFDPLLISDYTSPEKLIKKIQKVGDILHPFTEKLVFSFADISNYSRVEKNLKNKGINYIDFDTSNMEYLAEEISQLNTSRSWGVELGTCGEQISLEKFGIKHNKCIDDELILRITESSDRSIEFEQFLGYERQKDLFAIDDFKQMPDLKDKGQRKECGCIYSKDIGSYNTCLHGCIYCYANSSPEAAQKNRRKIKVESDALLS